MYMLKMSYNSDSDSDDSNNANNNNNSNNNNNDNNDNNNDNNKNDMSTMFSPTTTKNYKTVAETNRLGSLLANKIDKLTSERDEWHQQYDNIKGKYDKILKENDLLKLQIKGIATTLLPSSQSLPLLLQLPSSQSLPPLLKLPSSRSLTTTTKTTIITITTTTTTTTTTIT